MWARRFSRGQGQCWLISPALPLFFFSQHHAMLRAMLKEHTQKLRTINLFPPYRIHHSSFSWKYPQPEPAENPRPWCWEVRLNCLCQNLPNQVTWLNFLRKIEPQSQLRTAGNSMTLICDSGRGTPPPEQKQFPAFRNLRFVFRTSNTRQK